MFVRLIQRSAALSQSLDQTRSIDFNTATKQITELRIKMRRWVLSRVMQHQKHETGN